MSNANSTLAAEDKTDPVVRMEEEARMVIAEARAAAAA